MGKKIETQFPELDDLKKAFHFDHGSGRVWLEDERMLLFHAASLGALRNELIESLGWERAKGVLMRMGYQSGKEDARLARKLRSDVSDYELFAVGPQLHTLEGIVKVEPIKLEINIETGQHYGEFYWDNSFEAEQHLARYGIHPEAVCWNQIGYACGYSSELMGIPIIYQEIQCVGCGKERCRIVGKPAAEWENTETLSAYFSQGSVAETIFTLKDEVQNLRNAMKKDIEPKDFVGNSKVMRETLKMIEKTSQTHITVLMLGETGVGKDACARLLHNMSNLNGKPFVQVNCAAIPADLVEAELFGVEKGAYTGAIQSRPGRFERAHGGTLFLDEIGEMSLAVQAKLLRVLQTGEFERVGDPRTRRVNVRLITATNQMLTERVSKGLFRADLYYRINVFPIYLPALRARKEDIPDLANKFIGMFNSEHGKSVTGLEADVLDIFLAYDWPGNIRELENIIERGVILTDTGQRISKDHINLIPSHSSQTLGMNVEESLEKLLAEMQTRGVGLEELEQQLLDMALQKSDGNVCAASRILNISAAKYRYRINKMDKE